MTRLWILSIIGLSSLAACGCNGDGRLLPWRCGRQDDAYETQYAPCNTCPCGQPGGMVYDGSSWVTTPTPTTVPLPPPALPAGTIMPGLPGPVAP